MPGYGILLLLLLLLSLLLLLCWNRAISLSVAGSCPTTCATSFHSQWTGELIKYDVKRDTHNDEGQQRWKLDSQERNNVYKETRSNSNIPQTTGTCLYPHGHEECNDPHTEHIRSLWKAADVPGIPRPVGEDDCVWTARDVPQAACNCRGRGETTLRDTLKTLWSNICSPWQKSFGATSQTMDVATFAFTQREPVYICRPPWPGGM